MIIVNGDSFVSEYHLPTDLRWTTQIGADVNLAVGGGSNDRMFSTTIEFLTNNKVDTLMMGWTRWERSFLNKSNGLRYKICGNIATDEMFDDTANEPKIAEFYLKKIFNDFTQLKNTLVQMIHIQEYCKMKKIKLINFATVFDINDLNNNELQKIASTAYMSRKDQDMEIMGTKYNYEILKSYITRLDPNTWVDKQVFSSMKPLREGFPQIDGHVGIEGTKRWVEILQNHINIIQ